MADYSQTIFVGNLTKDPEFKWTQDERKMCVASFNIGIRNSKAKKDSKNASDYFRCVAFDWLAEKLNDLYNKKEFGKGTRVMVISKPKNNSYETDGVKVYTNDFICENVEIFEKDKTQSNGLQESQAPRKVQTTVSVQRQAPVQKPAPVPEPEPEPVQEENDGFVTVGSDPDEEDWF